MNEYHFDYSYSLNTYLDDDDELFPELNNSENSLYHNVHDSLNLNKCSFCCEFGHSLSKCVKACSLGQELYLKGLEVRHFDLEMCCLGNSVKLWLENLTLMELFVLAIRVKLEKYAYTLWERGMTDIDRSLLNSREDYITCLRLFYYFEPFGNTFKKKFDFKVGLLWAGKDDNNGTTTFEGTTFEGTAFEGTAFECPVCIESSLPIKEKIKLNCGHSICNSCFNNYLNHFENKNHLSKKPSCSLCRNTIDSAVFTCVDYLNNVKKSFIFGDI